MEMARPVRGGVVRSDCVIGGTAAEGITTDLSDYVLLRVSCYKQDNTGSSLVSGFLFLEVIFPSLMHLLYKVSGHIVMQSRGPLPGHWYHWYHAPEPPEL